MSLFFKSPEGGARSGWTPPADIYQTPSGWAIKLDLAGVCPDDLVVRRSGRTITIQGTRRDQIVEQGWSHYSMEISYNRFERTIELPCELEEARVEVEYREGMLLLFIETPGGTDTT